MRYESLVSKKNENELQVLDSFIHLCLVKKEKTREEPEMQVEYINSCDGFVEPHNAFALFWVVAVRLLACHKFT